MWIYIALLSPIFYGISNVLDNYLSNKKFTYPATLTFWGQCVSGIFVVLAFFVYQVSLPPLSLLPIFIVLGIINVVYLYPYFKGLQHDDTSTAISFFSLSRIFIPLWAFLIVGERLLLSQYLGLLLITISSILLSLRGTIKKIHFSKALLYILLSAFIISFEGVLLKYLFDRGVSVGTVVVGEMFFSFLCVFLSLCSKKVRKDIAKTFPLFRQNIGFFLVEEGATFIAFFVGSYAISIGPVSLVSGIMVLTPLMVLLYAKLFGKKFSDIFRETKGLTITVKKIVFFLVMAGGVWLMVG